MLCEIAGKSDVGRQRLRNEDNFLILETFALTVIADGMGGHIDGNIASQIAVDTIRELYQAQYASALNKEFPAIEERIKAQELFLTEATQQANRNIFNRNRGAFSLEGMGTTVVALEVSDGYAITACVGDSRIYLLRDKKLAQITQDHSLVGELVRYNIIDKKDMMFLQNKNIITRALGMTESVIVDTTVQKTSANDIFLLCSDGLTDLLSDEQIEKHLVNNQDNLDAAVETLVCEANHQGGLDNITVCLAKIVERQAHA
jgi:protein phosphatase